MSHQDRRSPRKYVASKFGPFGGRRANVLDPATSATHRNWRRARILDQWTVPVGRSLRARATEPRPGVADSRLKAILGRMRVVAVLINVAVLAFLAVMLIQGDGPGSQDVLFGISRQHGVNGGDLPVLGVVVLGILATLILYLRGGSRN